MKKLFSFLFVSVFLVCCCKSSDEFSLVRTSIEKSEFLIEDYRFCMYEKEGRIMQRKMERVIVNSQDQTLCNYFGSKRIKDKSVIAQVICRFLCRARENFGRPISTLSDTQFQQLLEYCIEEIQLENNGVRTVIRNRNGDVIYQGK